MAREVGIRELRNHLSQYLDEVQAGDDLVITDRGRGIARVVALTGARTIDRLVADGFVTPAARPKQPSRPPITIAGPVSDLIAAQRR